MKKQTPILLLLLGCGLACFFLGPFFSNLWLLSTGKGYFIPKESSIFTFRPTQFTDGSGEWWIYGMDDQRFYAYGFDGHGDAYAEIGKDHTPSGFNHQKFESWPDESIQIHPK